jgi:hypothetical protein
MLLLHFFTVVNHKSRPFRLDSTHEFIFLALNSQRFVAFDHTLRYCRSVAATGQVRPQLAAASAF